MRQLLDWDIHVQGLRLSVLPEVRRRADRLLHALRWHKETAQLKFLNVPGGVVIMQDGDFVSVDYVGRVKGTNEIFDVTIEDVAKKENVFNPKIKYKPVTLVVGGGFILHGLDEALHDMKVGERKTFEVAPEKAFGERRDELMKPIPAARFKE